MPDSSFDVVRLSPLRKAIATRMSEAKRNIPHFRLSAEIEIDALQSVREALNRDVQFGRLSLNDLIVKCCAAALMEVPEVNVQWAESAVHRFTAADISIVTAVPGGLSTPIIRAANTKPVSEISREIRLLAERAARHSLSMDEISGGSFSVSNLGMYGVESFDAIINSPQCAILAIGMARRALRIEKDGTPRPVSRMNVTLSVDHRAIDGATGAAFLSSLRRHLEQPELAMLTRGEQIEAA